jgi:ATP-binding cassette subfamily C (CFTR/MRP) protein 10
VGHDMGLKMLCRFSSDQYSIDDSLPFIANILLANVFMLSGIAIVLCYVQWTFLVVMLPIFYFFLILQVYFFKICVIDKLPFL